MIPSYLLTSLKAPIINPSGIWADYNHVHNIWLQLTSWAKMGEISLDDVPAEPNIDDYPDLTSQPTF